MLGDLSQGDRDALFPRRAVQAADEFRLEAHESQAPASRVFDRGDGSTPAEADSREPAWVQSAVSAERPPPDDPLPGAAVVLADANRASPGPTVSESLEMGLDALPIELQARIEHDRAGVELGWSLEHPLVQTGSHQRLHADGSRHEDRRR